MATNGRTMTIPTNLPTDNFYKFVTLLGLLIFALSVYGIVRVFEATNTEIRAYAEEYRRAEPTTRQAQFTEQIVQGRKESAARNVTLLIWCGLVGLVVALGGGIPWYFKHQVHLDRIIEIERAKVDPTYANKIGFTNGSEQVKREEPSAAANQQV